MPTKPLLSDLAALRRTFRAVLTSYSKRVRGRLEGITSTVKAQADAAEVPPERVREMRDVLMLLRRLDVTPRKGQRRDLKRIESLLDDLHRIARHW